MELGLQGKVAIVTGTSKGAPHRGGATRCI